MENRSITLVQAILVAVAMMFAGAAFADSSVVAKKKLVKILQEPSKKSPVIATLKKGEEVPSTGRQGMFWKVNTDGKEGFVSVLDVKRQAGASKSLAKAIRAAAKNGRDDSKNSSRARSAVMGVRGLDESEETAFAGNAKPNMRLVYAMEDFQIHPKRISGLGNRVMKEVEAMAERQDI